MESGEIAPARRGYLGPALAGGLIGSVLTAALLVFATPEFVSTRIVRQGLLANPAVLPETVEALRVAQFEPVISSNRAALETPFGNSWKGAENPDVTLVEFYDYACPYCKASNPHVDRLVREDKGLRVVYRELPILGSESLAASRVALQAAKAGRFHQFHDALWAAGRPGPDTIAAAARAAGVSPTPVEDAAAEDELRRNFQLAGQLGGTGTPLFVVGNRVINSAVGYEGLKEAIAAARAKG